MRAIPAAPAAAVLVFLLAGCSDGGQTGAAAPTASATSSGTAMPAASNGTIAPQPITLELGACRQMHTFFPFPVAVFENLGFTKPDGFEYASSDGETVEVLLAWWFCATGLLNGTPNGPFADLGSMLAAIPVEPPSSLTADDANAVPVTLDLLPLTWIVNNQLATDHLGGIEGLRDGYVERGDVQATDNAGLGPVSAQGAFAAASFGTFAVDLAYQPSGGAQPEGRYRLWLAPRDAATGYLDVVHGEGVTLGSGHGSMRFQGDAAAGAPPAWPGTAHLVDQGGVTIAHVSLADQETA